MRSARKCNQIMANQDLGDMLDLFRHVYDGTNGIDGYVSLEVSPLLTYETERTIAEARQLWTHLNQPNLFIKIPAVAQGMPAIEACIAEGINVWSRMSPRRGRWRKAEGHGELDC